MRKSFPTFLKEDSKYTVQTLVNISEVSMGRIRIRYLAGYFRFFGNRIGYGLFFKTIGPGQNQDICIRKVP